MIKLVKTSIYFLIIAVIVIAAYGCASSSGNAEDKQNQTIAVKNEFVTVSPVAQTEMVKSSGDAADDICIWYNAADPSASTIIATDKQSGLIVYDLNGKILHEYPVGEVNNVDIRQHFMLGGNHESIVGATNRTTNSLVFFKVDPQSRGLVQLETNPIVPKTGEVYGFTFFRSHNTQRNNQNFGKLYAVSIGTDGVLDQWELMDNNGKLFARYARIVRFSSKSEGMVADDENGNLFVGEEGVGIWKMPALPADGDKRELIADISKAEMEADVEGLAIYYGANNKGYLIASSQGNNSYAVFSREAPHGYMGSFMIFGDGAIDGVSETDGIDVINLNLGSDYPKGVFIAQDGYNYDGENIVQQNFKIVKWDDIAGQFSPWLLIDDAYNKDSKFVQ
jgi:3-phytase